MEYYNEFTLPSGRSCKLYEISNETYLELLKWTESDNKEMFFKTLERLIKKTVADFDELNVVDKGYLMMAFCLFNVRPHIKIIQERFGDIDIPVVLMMDNVEAAYPKDFSVSTKIGNLEVVAGLPTDYLIEDGEISVDYLSGLRMIRLNGKEHCLSIAERKSFIEKLQAKDMFMLSENIQKNLVVEVNIAQGTLAEGFRVNICGNGLFYISYQLIKQPLEQFYEMEYIMGQHVHFSRSDFLKMSPIESQFIVNKFVEEKRKQNEEMEKLRQQNNSSNPAGPTNVLK